MAKTVYRTRSFPAVQAQQHAVHPMAAVARQPMVVQPPRTVATEVDRGTRRRSSLMLLVGCLVLALMAVLLVPLMVGGTVASTTKLAVSSQAQRDAAYGSVDEAAAALDITATVPTMPAGYSVAACRVLEGSVLEVEYSNGRNVVLYRTAAGSDDLSDESTSAYAFTATETVDGISRGYAGVSEKKLNQAVWAYGGSSYAILTSEGMDAQALRELAESVK